MEFTHTGYLVPNKESLDKVTGRTKKEGILLGINLNEDEIMEVAKKNGRMVEVVLKPEIKITESHRCPRYSRRRTDRTLNTVVQLKILSILDFMNHSRGKSDFHMRKKWIVF